MSRTADVLKAALEYCRERHTLLGEIIPMLERTIARECEDIAEKPAEPVQRKKRYAIIHKPRQKSSGYTGADCIDVALEMIGKNGGSVKAGDVAKEIKRRFSGSGPVVGTVLWYDAEKAKSGQLRKVATGVYGRKQPVKHVDVKRTPEETERVLAAARANAERGIPTVPA